MHKPERPPTLTTCSSSHSTAESKHASEFENDELKSPRQTLREILTPEEKAKYEKIAFSVASLYDPSLATPSQKLYMSHSYHVPSTLIVLRNQLERAHSHTYSNSTLPHCILQHYRPRMLVWYWQLFYSMERHVLSERGVSSSKTGEGMGCVDSFYLSAFFHSVMLLDRVYGRFGVVLLDVSKDFGGHSAPVESCRRGDSSVRRNRVLETSSVFDEKSRIMEGRHFDETRKIGEGRLYNDTRKVEGRLFDERSVKDEKKERNFDETRKVGEKKRLEEAQVRRLEMIAVCVVIMVIKTQDENNECLKMFDYRIATFIEYLAKGRFSIEEVLDMEREILLALEFDIALTPCSREIIDLLSARGVESTLQSVVDDVYCRQGEHRRHYERCQRRLLPKIREIFEPRVSRVGHQVSGLETIDSARRLEKKIICIKNVKTTNMKSVKKSKIDESFGRERDGDGDDVERRRETLERVRLRTRVTKDIKKMTVFLAQSTYLSPQAFGISSAAVSASCLLLSLLSLHISLHNGGTLHWQGTAFTGVSEWHQKMQSLNKSSLIFDKAIVRVLSDSLLLTNWENILAAFAVSLRTWERIVRTVNQAETSNPYHQIFQKCDYSQLIHLSTHVLSPPTSQNIVTFLNHTNCSHNQIQFFLQKYNE